MRFLFRYTSRAEEVMRCVRDFYYMDRSPDSPVRSRVAPDIIVSFRTGRFPRIDELIELRICRRL